MEQPHSWYGNELKSVLHNNIIAGGLSATIAFSNSTPIQIHSEHANIAHNQQLNSTHVFGIGSITEVFIAVVVFQLVEESKLSMEDNCWETIMSSSSLSRTIFTPRLTIRLTDPGDEEDCKAILTFYDPVVRPDMQTPSDIRKKSEANMIKPDVCTLAFPPKGVFHLIYVNDSPDTSPVGFIGFSCRPKWPCSDLGYKLLPACPGKAYACEAGTAVLSFWRDEVGVKEICAPIGVANVASQRVAEKIGFVKDREFHGNGEGWKKAGGDEGEVAYVLPGMEGRIDWDSMELE